MEYLVKACYLDTRTGNLHTRDTKDGEILKKPLKPRHPALLLGQRVRLVSVEYHNFWEYQGTNYAYIKGQVVADHPINKTTVNVKITGEDILSLKWDGFGECNPPKEPEIEPYVFSEWDNYANAIENVTRTRWERILAANETFGNAEITGTLTLTEIGERYRAMGDLLRRTNYGSLFTLTDIEIKGGF